MKSALFITSVLATLVGSSAAVAMPEGTFDCVSRDERTAAHFLVNNYGAHILFDVLGVVVDAEPVADRSETIVRQWISDTVANVDLNLPHGEKFSRNLVIETTSPQGDSVTYTGTAKVIERQDEYSSPQTTTFTTDITCTYEP